MTRRAPLLPKCIGNGNPGDAHRKAAAKKHDDMDDDTRCDSLPRATASNGGPLFLVASMADTIGALPSLQTVARALGGEINNGQILAPGPDHSAADRSLSVKIDSAAPDGFLTHSFSGDDPVTCRDYVRERLGLPRLQT